jgi:hypothetical protein
MIKSWSPKSKIGLPAIVPDFFENKPLWDFFLTIDHFLPNCAQIGQFSIILGIKLNCSVNLLDNHIQVVHIVTIRSKMAKIGKLRLKNGQRLPIYIYT